MLYRVGKSSFKEEFAMGKIMRVNMSELMATIEGIPKECQGLGGGA